MDTFSVSKRAYISSWLLGSFAMALLILLVFNELFQTESKKNNKLDFLNNPIRADILANIKTIRIKNRLGSYTLTKDSDQWFLKEPRLMPANARTIQLILNSLEEVNVRTIHEFEPINISNFSLDNPIMVLDLYTELDEQFKVNIGLVNPINNTSYMTVSNQKTIYQTDVIKSDIQSMQLADFIDSSIFSADIKDITEFEIFHRGIASSYNHLELKNGTWESKKYKTIQNESVEKKLSSILNIKTHMIIDRQDEELITFINNYLDKPLYTIKIKTNSKEITYKVSSLVNAISELKIEKRQYFLMSASDRKYTYLIQKDNLNNFIIRYSDLK